MEAKDLLLITPPFTQLNTPYPATAQLKGFLQEQGFKLGQIDLGIETLLSVFSKKSLTAVFDTAEEKKKLSAAARRILNLRRAYETTIDTVIEFLQGKDQSLAYRICNGLIPQGSRFDIVTDLDWHFGSLGIQDKAKFLATLYIEDLGDFIQENIDPHFGFSRYAEHIGINAFDFDPLEAAVGPETIISKQMYEILNLHLTTHKPKIVGLSVPFPGNLLAALKSARHIKTQHPEIKIILGGGYANTELRDLNETRIFDYVDYICLDDGERSLLQLLNHLLIKSDIESLVRTFCLVDGKVQYYNNESISDFSHEDIGTPDYEGLPIDQYISVLEMANPMHRMWSDGRWNKLAIAHGCYWHKCSFCDTSLDYIKRYSQASIMTLCNRIESVISQTGQRGFHFVDEAAPPKVLRELAIELIRRGLNISWWTNIRFEKTFNKDLCELLAHSGCIAVTGGLEVASDRLLKLMQKGVDIEQVAQVTHHFQEAGIMVHAYLMFGFPTQSDQETIDSLEVVRQLFEAELLQSAFWHKFAMTVHSPVGIYPEKYDVERIEHPTNSFAKNDCQHIDNKGCDHEKYSFGLKKALYNYMHQQCYDYRMQEWFDFKVPPTTVQPYLIAKAVKKGIKNNQPTKGRCLWLGSIPIIAKAKKRKALLIFDTTEESVSIEITEAEAKWIKDILEHLSIHSDQIWKLEDVEKNYNESLKQDFKSFAQTKEWKTLRMNGLLIL
ncbi:MAG: radical SAM protein [Bacteroidales bacterium]|nr:radical SAM protein [Bacteroidales bacterium]